MPVTGPHFPSVPHVAEGCPVKPFSHVAKHMSPGLLLFPQAKVPSAGLGGLPGQPVYDCRTGHMTAEFG